MKSNSFKDCAKFKDLDGENYLRKIFLNDDPPLTRKEHERLSIKMKGLREQEQVDPDEPQNRYYIKKGTLHER